MASFLHLKEIHISATLSLKELYERLEALNIFGTQEIW